MSITPSPPDSPVATPVAAARPRWGALLHIVNHIGVAVASKLVPVASIFLYSHYMSVYEYGVLNLSSSYLWILAIVMTLNLHTGVGRYIYTESADFGGFLGTTFIAIGAAFLAVAAAILFNLAHFERWMMLPREVIALLLLIVLGSIAESIFTQIAIYLQSSARLVKVVSAKAVATLALSVGLLYVVPTEKYLAVLYADALISMLFVAYVGLALRGRTCMAFCATHLRYMVRYAVPLIPYMLCLTLLSQFDRVMIDRYFGKAETGLYSLAYNVGILMLMVVTALLNVFNPAFFDSLNRKDYGRVLRDSDGIFALGTLVTVALVLFGEQGFALIVPAKYAPALDLIPVVAIGGLCFVIFQLWARLIAYVNRTYLLSLIALAAVVLKIGLNVVLLPLFGYKAAAATTVLAYLTMSVSCVWVVNGSLNLFQVRLSPSLGYLGLCTLLVLLFAFVPMAPLVAYPAKLALLLLFAWRLRRRILGLLALRDIAGRK